MTDERHLPLRPLTIVACGALAREINTLIRVNGWSGVRLRCLPADLHNDPDSIPDAVKAILETVRRNDERAFVAYADCGTNGRLDKVLNEYNVDRLAGTHCYDVFAGDAVIQLMQKQEPGTFYLTDFLARHFDRLVMADLGISLHPELLSMYFGQYRRLVYLSQQDDPELLLSAKNAADQLGLRFEHRPTGYSGLESSLVRFIQKCG